MTSLLAYTCPQYTLLYCLPIIISFMQNYALITGYYYSFSLFVDIDIKIRYTLKCVIFVYSTLFKTVSWIDQIETPCLEFICQVIIFFHISTKNAD